MDLPAIFVPVAEASIAEAFPTKVGERISLFSSSTYIGRGIAPILGATILTLTNSNFHMLYLAVSVAGLTALITAIPISYSKWRKHSSNWKKKEHYLRDVSRLRTTIRNRAVLTVCLLQACQYYVYGAFEFYLSGYLKE